MPSFGQVRALTSRKPMVWPMMERRPCVGLAEKTSGVSAGGCTGEAMPSHWALGEPAKGYESHTHKLFYRNNCSTICLSRGKTIYGTINTNSMGLNDTSNCVIDGGVTMADSTSSINKSVVVSVEDPLFPKVLGPIWMTGRQERYFDHYK